MKKSKVIIRLLAIFLVMFSALSFGILGLKYFNIIQYESFNILNIVLGFFLIIAFAVCTTIVKSVVSKVWSESLKTE